MTVESTTEATTTTEAVEPDPSLKGDTPARDELLRKVYGEATKALREAHTEEFLDLREKFAAEYGVEWKRPESEEAKAAKEMRALAEKFPQVAADLFGTK